MRKSNDYGDVFKELGLAGQYSDMHRKMAKLKKRLWDKEPLAGEQVDEILSDLFGNVLISLYLLMYTDTRRERFTTEEDGELRYGGQKVEGSEVRYESGAGQPPNPAAESLTFLQLREANVSRKARWHGDADPWNISDWTNAMAGEVGEACNIGKKLRRHETGTGTSYNTPDIDTLTDALAQELADVVTYADLVAAYAGIDLDHAVRTKFNKVSEAQGFPERL